MIFFEDQDYEDELAKKVIRLGLNIRDDFWDDFIRITNNSKALGSLLGIKSEKISSWAAKIRIALNKVNKEIHEKPKKKIINTGKEKNYDTI